MTPPATLIFAAIYDSPWHHPVLCWAATPLVLGALWRARRNAGAAANPLTLWRLALLGQLLIVLDALATGGWSPLAPTSLASSLVGVLFVVLGDLRYFVLLERFAPPERAGGPERFLWRALGLSVLTLWLSLAIAAAAPAWFQLPQRKFLLYEALFLPLLAWVRWVRLPRWLAARAPGAETEALRQWLQRLTGFEAAQYALWVIADVLILADVPAALLLRLVPNALYYCGFIGVAYFTAPPSLRPAVRAA